MTDEQSGFMSNRYAYDPMAKQDGPWKESMGQAGSAIFSAVAQTAKIVNPVLGTAVAVAADHAGTFIGEAIGEYVDNSETVMNNVETFVAEITDWRALADAMQNYSAISWNPNF